MPDSVRPGQYSSDQPTRASVIVTISVDVELDLLDAHASLPRIDTVARRGNTVLVFNGTPAPVPIPVRLSDEFTRIAEITIPAMAASIWPGSIKNLQSGPKSS